ncbi:hypothetical protein A6S26_19505 [Nostoc sp. ATCC 43529]|nr:hypothetical protein A6S26_19505 [Nostoc sp. ATCC 43529]
MYPSLPCFCVRLIHISTQQRHFFNLMGFAVVLIGLYLAISSQVAAKLRFQESVNTIFVKTLLKI